MVAEQRAKYNKHVLTMAVGPIGAGTRASLLRHCVGQKAGI